MVASGWTNATARAVMDDQFGVTARTAPTLPLKWALEVSSAMGTADSPGTELASTPRPTIAFGAASVTDPPVSSNNASVTVVCGASGNVGAHAVYDSSAIPVRVCFGQLSAARTVVSGDSVIAVVGAVTFSDAHAV